MVIPSFSAFFVQPVQPNLDEIYRQLDRASDCFANVATVLGLIPAAFDTAESEGRHLQECVELTLQCRSFLSIHPIYRVRSTRLHSSVPLLEPGTPRLLVVCNKRINHSRVATNTRPTECPTQPRRMIDASRVYTFILTTKCIQNWAYFKAISCAKNRTRADSTSLTPRTVTRYEARHERRYLFFTQTRC